MYGVDGCTCGDSDFLCGACLDEMTADREAEADAVAKDWAEQSAFESWKDGDR